MQTGPRRAALKTRGPVRPLLTAITIIGALGAAAPPALAVAPEIDLAQPTATVVDPVAALAPVNTECSSGQVDLNTASAEALAAALDVPSDPTVRRLIEMRPWLKGSDLSSVPGIGPDRAKVLAPKTCATQPVLPAPAPLACATSSQVDIQAASAPSMSSRLKIPLTTAKALVDARPLSQHLAQVITPRVPGLDRPLVMDWLAKKTVCVTPAPMLAGGSAWRWATDAGGAVVTRGGFSLIVPPGRVISSVGAYVSVTPLPLKDGVLPRMDAHIWGDWNTPQTTVAVQGPWQDPGVAGMRPIVLHDAADGESASEGSSVAVSGSVVTALQRSLSETSYGLADCASGEADITSPLCLEQLTDGTLARQWREQAFRSGSRIQIGEKPSCGTVGVNPISATLGKLPFGLSCSVSQNQGTGSWEITNDATGELLGVHLDVLYRYNVSGAQPTNKYVDGTKYTDPWMEALRIALNLNTSVLVGNQTLHIDKAPDSGETTVGTEVDPILSGAWAVAPSLTAMAGIAFGPVLHASSAAIGGCAALIEERAALTTVASCIKTATQDSAEQYLKANPLEAGKKPSVFQRLASTVKFAAKALDVASFVGSFGSAVAIKSFGDGSGIVLRNNRLPAPGTGGGEGGAGGGVIAPGDSFIARDPGGRSVLVKPNGTVLNIRDGGTFLCLAATWAVWDNPKMPQLNKPTSGDAGCGDAGSRRWNFRPVREGGNVPDNVLLREQPRDATGGVIASYLINSSGEIQTIPNGWTYECLASSNPVIWNVPYGNVPEVGIQQWRPVGTAPANCG